MLIHNVAAYFRSPRAASEPGPAAPPGAAASLDRSIAGGAAFSFTEAIRAAERAVHAGGTAADWSDLAMLYGRSGAHELAVDTAHRAIELDPLRTCAWRTLSVNLARYPERQSQALKAQRRLAMLTGKPGDWTALARDLMRSGRYEEARDAALWSLGLDESQADAWRALAISAEQSGDIGESVAAWKRVDLLLGSSVNNYAKAACVAHGRVRREPFSSEAWRQLATAYGRMGRDREAVEVAEQAFAADPAISASLIALLDELLNRAPHEASELLRKMVAADSRNAYFIHLLGVAGSKAGKCEEALEQMRLALQLAPSEPRYWYALGRALEKAGGDHQHEALASYSKALELKPTYGKARTRMEELRRALWDVAN